MDAPGPPNVPKTKSRSVFLNTIKELFDRYMKLLLIYGFPHESRPIEVHDRTRGFMGIPHQMVDISASSRSELQLRIARLCRTLGDTSLDTLNDYGTYPAQVKLQVWKDMESISKFFR